MYPPRRSKVFLASTLFSLVGACATMLLLWSAWHSRAGNGDARPTYREEEVRFDAGKNHLVGTLVRPTAPGPHPAVVFLTGAGATDRTGQEVIPTVARHLAAYGFICLSWDRPGVGASSGHYDTQSIADRADEALAAVRFLQGQTDVRRDTIGLVGLGQGGVAAPVAAAQSRDIAFIIDVASCQLVGWVQELYRIENELRADGFNDAAISEALELTRLKIELMRGSGPYEEFDETQKQLVGRPWFQYLQYCERKRFDASKLTVEFDPAPFWEKVHCPVLAIFGAKDTTGPMEASASVIRGGLEKASNADLTIKIIPRADHLMTVSDTGGRKETDERAKRRPAGEGPEIAPGYVEGLTSWLVARFGTRR